MIEYTRNTQRQVLNASPQKLCGFLYHLTYILSRIFFRKNFFIMKILILSDIHGNYQALTSIKEEADMVLCLGDIVNYGPNPAECLEWVKGHGTKIVRGNHDNAVGLGADCGCSLKYKELSDTVKAFTVAALNNNDKKFLGSLPIKEHVKIDGFNFLLSHGSPNGDMYKYLSPDVSDSELLSELGDENADFAMPCRHDVVLIGHTHLPMIKKVDGITIVNPGSVGQPRDGIPLCSYAVWDDGNIEIKRVEYDIDATINAYEATSIPKQHIKTLSQILKTGGRF